MDSMTSLPFTSLEYSNNILTEYAAWVQIFLHFPELKLGRDETEIYLAALKWHHEARISKTCQSRDGHKA